VKIFADKALLPQGWADAVALTITAMGDIVSVEKNTRPPPGSKTLPLMIPGMVDTHSHAFQRAFAGLTENHATRGGNFWAWRRTMYALLQRLTVIDMKNIARHLYIELLKGGYTAVAEFHYLHHLAGAENIPGLASARALLSAAEDAGIGCTLLPTLYRTSNFDGQHPKPSQKPFVLEIDNFIHLFSILNDDISQNTNQALGLAFHSLRAVSPDNIKSVLNQIKMGDSVIPKHIHIAEQEKEVRDCLAHTGTHPVDFLMNKIDVDHSWTLVHATHITPHECDLVAKSGALVALCPTTEANLGDGIFPLQRLIDGGGRFAVGSDSHVCVDAAEELRFLAYVRRLMTQTRSNGTGGHAGTMLWSTGARHGAAACGRKIGVLEVGARADLITLEMGHPQLTGRRSAEQILDTYLFGGCNSLVRDVMVGGKWVVRRGRHTLERQAAQAYQATLARVID